AGDRTRGAARDRLGDRTGQSAAAPHPVRPRRLWSVDFGWRQRHPDDLDGHELRGLERGRRCDPHLEPVPGRAHERNDPRGGGESRFRRRSARRAAPTSPGGLGSGAVGDPRGEGSAGFGEERAGRGAPALVARRRPLPERLRQRDRAGGCADRRGDRSRAGGPDRLPARYRAGPIALGPGPRLTAPGRPQGAGRPGAAVYYLLVFASGEVLGLDGDVLVLDGSVLYG